MSDTKAFMQIKSRKPDDVSPMCRNNYRAKYRKPSQAKKLGGLLNTDLSVFLVAGVGFEPTTFRL
jgi:hypothetical protein